MAGAFSQHLLESYLQKHVQSRAPFGGNTTVTTHGAMSFSPQMHGNFNSQNPMDPNPSYLDLSEATAMKIATLQAKLNKKLGPEYISQRPGPGGGPKLTYAEGWKIINLANEVFGFNGWSSNVVNLATDFVDFNEETRRWNVGVTAVMRVTLRDGVFHEDVGYGMLENSKSKGGALDKCKKEAITDGIKRSLRNFGNLLGNCLYDKAYTQEVIKVKVQPVKFDPNTLHRRPEFETATPNQGASTSKAPPKPAQNGDSGAHASGSNQPNQQAKPQVNKPISSIPPHMQQQQMTNNAKGKAPAYNANNAGLSISHSNASRSGMGLNAAAQQQQQQHQKTPISNNTSNIRKVAFAESPGNASNVSANTTGNSSIFSNISMGNETANTSIGNGSMNPAAVAVADCDDEYPMHSDDQEMFGLGEGDEILQQEGDMGRPIDEDTDLGQPIDFEEGRGARSSGSSDSEARGEQGRQHQRQPPQQQAQRQGPVPVPVPQRRASNQPRPPPSAEEKAARIAEMQRSMQEQPPPPARPQQLQQATASSSNGNSRASVPGPPPAPVKRSTTPAMGGFNFPPGIDPRTLGAGNHGPPRMPTSGIKRTADTMQHSGGSGLGSTTTRNVPFPAALTQQGGIGRQPLGSLLIGEGGDVKRVKR